MSITFKLLIEFIFHALGCFIYSLPKKMRAAPITVTTLGVWIAVPLGTPYELLLLLYAFLQFCQTFLTLNFNKLHNMNYNPNLSLRADCSTAEKLICAFSASSLSH